MSESTTMPKDENEALATWAAEWADKFDQDYNETNLRALVGENVQGLKPAETEEEGPKGFKGKVVGFSIDTLCFTPEGQEEPLTAHRYSLILAQGMQVALLSGMEVTVVADEPE